MTVILPPFSSMKRPTLSLLSAGTVVALLGVSTAFAQSTRVPGTATTVKPAPVTTVTATTMPGCVLWIDGVQGEGSSGVIEVHSWSWGASNPTSIGSSGLSAGKVSMSDLSLMKRVDKASPQLFMSVVSGTRMKAGKLSCRNAAGQEYYVLNLADVGVSSLNAQSGTDRPMESLSLNFAKIEFSYSPTKTDGSLDTAIKATYDLKAAKK